MLTPLLWMWNVIDVMSTVQLEYLLLLFTVIYASEGHYCVTEVAKTSAPSCNDKVKARLRLRHVAAYNPL